MAGVLVAGAGPTGLTLALQLARYGVPVRVIDAAYAPAAESRAAILHPRRLELFARMEVAAPFLERGVRYREIAAYSNRKPVAQEPVELLALSQSETEAILGERLRALEVKIERGVRLVHLEQDAVRVRVHLRGSDGETFDDFSYVAGCDGAESAVRHILDVPFAGPHHAASFAMADVAVDVDLPRDAVSIFLVAGNVAAMLPLAGDLWRIILERSGGFDATPSLDDFRSALYLSGVQAKSYGEPRSLANYRPTRQRVAAMAKGRVFLAGDAAQVHSPLGALGMNAGISDAENLAWKLALTYRHGASEALLDSYRTEREAVAMRLARVTGSFTAVAGDRKLGARLREAFVGPQIVYARSAAISPGRSPHPQPGARAPDGALIRAGGGAQTSIFALASSLRYLLLIFTYRRDQFVHELLLALGRYGSIVDPCVVARDATIGGAQLLDPTGAVFRTYGAEGEPQYVLIRPDTFIAARGALRDHMNVIAHLQGLFAQGPTTG
jgi:2-polyprenyl-6-methoxyphenol hydroxylase-like FAD-dependent oxidoreductase